MKYKVHISLVYAEVERLVNAWAKYKKIKMSKYFEGQLADWLVYDEYILDKMQSISATGLKRKVYKYLNEDEDAIRQEAEEEFGDCYEDEQSSKFGFDSNAWLVTVFKKTTIDLDEAKEIVEMFESAEFEPGEG
jgi:hypothetical protein